MPRIGKCKHCKQSRRIVAVGLCHTHYTDVEIRKLYPKTKPGARKQVGDMSRFRPIGGDNAAGKPPREPTDAVPCSDDKVAALQARVARGEALWHPGGARRDLT